MEASTSSATAPSVSGVNTTNTNPSAASLSIENSAPTTTTTTGSSGSSASSVLTAAMVYISSGPMAHPTIRWTLYWVLGIRTMADALPGPLQYVVNSGKMSLVVFFAFHFALAVLWLPFWLCSLVVSEIGVYLLSVALIYLIGRGIIRMIAFPGSSSRVSSEIEKEFAKYSVRLILSACNSLLDLASAISAASNGEPTTSSRNEIQALWKRSKSYRDRILAVYAQVLTYILKEGHQSTHPKDPKLTKYGNNRIAGDVGDLSGLTLEARGDGERLLEKINKVLMEVDRLEDQSLALLEGTVPNTTSGRNTTVTTSVKMTANSLGLASDELRTLTESMRPKDFSMPGYGEDDEDDEDVNMDSVRRRFEEQNTSFLDSIKSALASILPMLDPPLHTSIFGFDLQRGCMLARYKGAKQLWVERASGGMVDVIHVPAMEKNPDGPNKKAVMYCNPNAGLIEVAAGLSLIGGNIAAEIEGIENDKCWTDFYTNAGYDMYLFNYAGFGRSHGAGYCGIGKRGGEEPYIKGIMGRVRRICHATFCGFQPTPESLRTDGYTVASHIVSHCNVDNLIIHGESIGGVAASSCARKLCESSFHREKIALLVCDRTFCNLEAVAQRLVGGWSGYAIRSLAPFWSTDVTVDFASADCAKVVANDAADSIIFDSASLRAGLAMWKEIHRGTTSAAGIGWKTPGPLHYRMAVDYENVPVPDSRYSREPSARRKAPMWPADKNISLEDGFHFAACVKRIGKVASFEKKRFMSTDPELSLGSAECSSPIYIVWKYLGTCEGMCGSALGMAVKNGYDVTLSWLVCTLVFGGQCVIEGMEMRTNQAPDSFAKVGDLGAVSDKDFDCRPPDYHTDESETVVHPKPIPEVIEAIKSQRAENTNDDTLRALNHELVYVQEMLQYVVSRLSASQVLEVNWKNRHLENGSMSVGSFLNLHCGHNNPFEEVERSRLRSLLAKASQSPQKS